MADIVDVIFSKYKIDIKETNIIKLYKIDNSDIAQDELEKKIAECRKKWQLSINGANEKFAERDKVHLENADIYEKILRDKKLRKDLLTFYNKSNKDDAVLEFACDYFKMIGNTTKIHKKEVEFFFAYFPDQKKYRKEIQEMLKKEYKVMLLSKASESSEEEVEIEEIDGKKKNASLLITNLFQEATIINLRKCEILFQASGKSERVCARYPDLKKSMYDFLQIRESESFSDFKSYIEEMRRETANLKYDNGQEYAPLMDLFNNLSGILEYNDVVDNYQEFKLLIQYPELTPYMYMFQNMKPDTLNDFYSVACKYYGFRNLSDFILTYFIKIYDNFGIYDQSIKAVLKKAEKNAGKKNVLDKLDKMLGLSKEKKMPLSAKIVHILTYWPIYILFGLFEVTKFIVDNMRYISLAAFIPMFVFMVTKAPDVYGVEFSAIKGVISKDVWLPFLDDFIGIQTGMKFEIIFASIEAIILLLMLFVFPPVIGTIFLWTSASHLTKRYDWKGIERTLIAVLQDSRKRTEEKYKNYKAKLLTRRLPNIILNLICVFSFILLISFVPKGIHFLQEKIEYNFRTNRQEEILAIETGSDELFNTPELITYEVYIETANIRNGPSKDYEIVTTASGGSTFIGTGKQETAKTGTVWYEIYLDKEQISLGWASETVIRAK
jgi:hypothetical protein